MTAIGTTKMAALGNNKEGHSRGNNSCDQRRKQRSRCARSAAKRGIVQACLEWKTVGMSEFDDRAFRNAMGNFCTGIVVVTGMNGDQPSGFAAQSFVSLSLTPPLVAVCPGKTSSSWPKISSSGHFCIQYFGSGSKTNL